jgi:hypothetical protein
MGLKINFKKTELMKVNTNIQLPVTVGLEPVREVEYCICLRSVVTRVAKTAIPCQVRPMFTMQKNIWASKDILYS